MNNLVVAGLAILITTVISIAGFYVMRWRYPPRKLVRDQHIVDPMLNVVATLYSVFLGFLVAGAMDRYEDIKSATETEATNLSNIFHLAKGLPEADRLRIRKTCREYAAAAIDEEWPLMENRQTSDKVHGIYLDLWDELLSISPDDDREVNTHESMLTAVQALAESRRTRLISMRKEVPGFIWLVIYSSSGVTVFLTYFFATREARLHSLMIALVAVTICLNVLVLVVLAEPFRGAFKIAPDGLESCRTMFNQEPDTAPKYLPAKSPGGKKGSAKSKDDDDD